MIRVTGLHVAYEDNLVLQDIHLEIDQGEFILITGPSGCGKSTLALTLSGLLPQSIPAHVQGRVEIDDLDTQTDPIRDIVQQIGIVFQNPSSQLFHLRVEDEVAFGPRNLGLDEDEVHKRTDWALNATGLDLLRNKKPSELSGGQKQCVAIASVLAMKPKILILDEPTASLDVPSSRRVLDTVKALQQEQGVTVIVVEHRLVDVAQKADRLLLMDAGKIVADDTPAQILSDQAIREAFGLRRMTEETSVNWETLIHFDGEQHRDEDSLLSLDHVAAGYNRKAVIEDINLSILPGDFVALVGNNGTGKSTLGLVCAGLLKPLTGTIRYQNGKRPRPGLDVAMLFQNPTDQLFTDSVGDEIAFGPQNYRCFDADFHNQILKEADLAHLCARRPMMLSIGQQQRTALSASLGLRPRLLILDEPTLGQDWGHLQRLMDFLTLLNQQGTAILLISHDYKLVHRYARRVFLMKKGRMYLAGDVDKPQESKFQIAPSTHNFTEGEVYETYNA